GGERGGGRGGERRGSGEHGSSRPWRYPKRRRSKRQRLDRFARAQSSRSRGFDLVAAFAEARGDTRLDMSSSQVQALTGWVSMAEPSAYVGRREARFGAGIGSGARDAARPGRRRLRLGKSCLRRPARLVHEVFGHVDGVGRHQRSAGGHQSREGNLLRLSSGSRLRRLVWLLLRRLPWAPWRFFRLDQAPARAIPPALSLEL